MNKYRFIFLLIVCTSLFSCRHGKENNLHVSLTPEDMAVFKSFRDSDIDNRESVGEDVVELLTVARTSFIGDNRLVLSKDRLEEYLGTPYNTEKSAEQTRFIYKVGKSGGEQKYLVLVLIHDVFVTTESMWSIE